MFIYQIPADSTDVSVVIRIIDSTDGTPETGVVFNTSGIDLEYRREGAASTDITEATLAALTTAHTDGGFLHIGNGYYRLDLPDAAVASGAAGCLVHGTVTGMVVIGCYIQIGARINANVTHWLGTAAATPTVAGVPEVDVTHWIGTAAATPTVAGVPEVDITHFGGSAGTFASGIPAASLTTSAINGVADQVWDEATSGHVASGSFGAANNPTEHGTAQAGGANTITLRAGASASNDYYNKQLLKIVAGTGAGQSEYISDYVGATKVATMAASWITQPDNTSVYVIHEGGTIPGASAPTAGEVADAVWDEARADHVSSGTFGEYFMQIFRRNTAQAGASGSITLDASASATDNLYRYNQVSIISGTGAGQSRQISAYNGTSKVATVGVAWTVAPSSDSVFLIGPLGVDAATVAAIADAIWDEARADHVTAGSFGEHTNTDVVKLSGDATAADNMESFFDGTGYAGTGNTIPTVTTVTNTVTANATLVNGAHGGAAATLTLKSVAVANGDAGGVAVNIEGTGSGNSHALRLQSTNGHGMAIGSTNGNAINAASSAADAVSIAGGTNSDGLQVAGNGTGVDIRANITGNLSGSVGSVTAVSDKTGYALSNAGVDALFTRQLTASYAAAGVAPTVAQALLGLQQRFGNFAISGTTLTVYGLDGTTPVATYTLNDASAPTALTRAT